MAQVGLGRESPEERVEGCIREHMLTSTVLQPFWIQGCFSKSEADLRQDYVVHRRDMHDGRGIWEYSKMLFVSILLIAVVILIKYSSDGRRFTWSKYRPHFVWLVELLKWPTFGYYDAFSPTFVLGLANFHLGRDARFLSNISNTKWAWKQITSPK